MFLHDYKCPSCNHIQEESHRPSERPEIKCSKCGNIMSKQIGSAGFSLKGNGWYKNGYKGR